ncbi:TatD family hydrolase [Patescibacteria group bacterium]|nr:TatD family hydrolase [Patescibacteria group bacterium]
MLIDTHAHLNFADYDKDRDEIIKRALDNNTFMINIGTNYGSSKEVIEIAEKYEKGVYAAIGLHPINIKQNSKLKSQSAKPQFKTQNSEDILEENFDYEKYKELAESEKVVAIGEIGFDYWRKPKTEKRLELFKQWQKEFFLKQLELARELNLPVIFHCRLALDELREILRRTVLCKLNGVVHCFTGIWEQAQKFLDMGFYLGFNGIIFKSIEGISFNEVIKKIPLDRILIETDCPFLVPPAASAKASASQERNEPLYVKYIAQRIAEIKNLSFEEVAERTTQNAKKLFKLENIDI